MVTINSMVRIIHCYSRDAESIVVVNGVKYRTIDFTPNNVKDGHTEYQFASLHDDDGTLRTVFYFTPLDHGQCYVVNEGYGPEKNSADLGYYVWIVPNLSKLYDGDLDVIATVKDVIDIFHKNRQTLDNDMAERRSIAKSHSTKACRN